MKASSRLSPPGDKSVARLRARLESRLEAQDWPACIEACQALLKVEPRHHYALETLATALLQNEQVDEAIEIVARLLQVSPRDPLHRLRLATLLQMQGRHGASLGEFERVASIYPNEPFSDDAREAVENLDRLQTSQILLLAAEQDAFRWQLERDPEVALEQFGFYLSENGFESLRQMIPNSEDEIEVRAPKIH